MILVQVGAFTSEVLGVIYLEKDVPAVLQEGQFVIALCWNITVVG